ncbi:hypothetical protein [Methanonatronarchaeum sp. AMET-Sl]|uniref:hypothetical protein n=1 Tax=Methanonatronarchaeum sp. AMET-Sl TaxID=3037654 RepID=UPI00244DCD60|nr:hypothetical protein [Methanonatronarchaeum sp. AMET-Sl]WGI16739.1 hypothetical protein QEN48_04395 [Methanonatronarchaeum sp. AMET-Sl]
MPIHLYIVQRCEASSEGEPLNGKEVPYFTSGRMSLNHKQPILLRLEKELGGRMLTIE